jgi:hypothetical protein
MSPGHSLPAGPPLRQLVLEVRADSYGGEHLREERVYMRKVADQQGAEIGQTRAWVRGKSGARCSPSSWPATARCR